MEERVERPEETSAARAAGSPTPSAPRPPTEAEIERAAVPATVRRAPRYGAFITTGVTVGGVLGAVLALVWPAVAHGNEAVSVFFSGVYGATLGAMVAVALAIWADRRSRRSR